MKQLILWTWCLPQTFVGWLVYLANRPIMLEKEKYRGVTFVKLDNSANFSGVALGAFVLLKNKHWRLRHIKHEYGHVVQGYRLGWLYLVTVGIRSAWLNKNQDKLDKDYFEYWPENSADKLGKVSDSDKWDRSKAYLKNGEWCVKGN